MEKKVLLRNADDRHGTRARRQRRNPGRHHLAAASPIWASCPATIRRMPLDKQKGDEPSKQHGFAQFYFTATFTQLAV